MELKINRDIFFREIQKIQNITPIKGTKPILSYFLLEAKKNGIYVFASDLDVGIKIFIDTEVSKPGEICLPARVVYDILRELPEDSSIQLILEENNRIRLVCMNSKFHIPGIMATEFPPFPVLDTKNMYSLSLEILLDMFVKINVAVPVFEQKIYNAPAGAFFTINEKGIEMAGTDGHRMAYIFKEGVKLPIQANGVLPKKLLDELPKILTDWEKKKGTSSENEDKKDAIKIGLSGNHSIFSLPNVQIYARFLEKKFPDYKGPIATYNEKQMIIDRDRFRQAVRRVSLITEKKDWFVLFKIFPGKLILDSESAEAGDAHDEIDVEYQGEPLEIGFNPKYILDFLSVIESPEVALEMSDNESLAILRPSDKENVKFIIMPVRL